MRQNYFIKSKQKNKISKAYANKTEIDIVDACT